MAEFIERKVAPKKDNKYYYSDTNPDFPKWENECDWYVLGRLLELGIPRETLIKNLPTTTNAENWYHDTKFEKRNYPSVGDVICYSAGKRHYAKDGEGHVAMIEEMFPDGRLLISESGKNMKFQTRIIKPPYNFYLNVKNKKNYVLDGFIHIQDYDNVFNWVKGNYTVTDNKYLRYSPVVKAGNKCKWDDLSANAQKKCYADSLGFARYYKGSKVNIKEFSTDTKKNIWGRTNTLWFCVQDSNGRNAKKVVS